VASSLNLGIFTLAGGSAETITGLASNPSTTLKAPATNTSDIELGPAGFTAGTGYPLSPGESISTESINVQTIRVRGTAGQKIAFAQEVN
jgi:hypothetical protein